MVDTKTRAGNEKGLGMKKKFEKWEKIREKGKWDYIIKYGVLVWGIGTAIAYSIIMHQINKGTSFLVTLGLSLVLFPLGGIAWGYFMWCYMEKAYQKSKTS